MTYRCTLGAGLLLLSLTGLLGACGKADAQPPPASPPPVDAPAKAQIDASTKAQILDKTLHELLNAYIFLEVAQEIESDLRRRQHAGEYDPITSAEEFALKLTADLQAVSHDKHLNVLFIPEGIPPFGAGPTPEEIERYQASGNFAFKRVERLDGNVGYLRFDEFAGSESVLSTMAAAMEFVKHTNALIIDLRYNRGGSPFTVALLCSYFFGPQRIHLNDIYWRGGNRIDQFFTRPDVPGSRYLGKDVYVLTSDFTFSAAEEFAYDLKNLGRIKLVGETTKGGANPGGAAELHPNFLLFVPTGRAINPITGTNWEGTGVKPDVEVPAASALTSAHLMAVQARLQQTAEPFLPRERQELEQLATQLRALLDAGG